MAKSILQRTKECYVCRMLAEEQGYYGELPSTGLHKHHVVFGKGNRKLAEHYGLWVYLCTRYHHEYGPAAVHKNRGLRLMLSCIAQRAFEAKYPTLDFLEIFGIRYLEPEEEFYPNATESIKNAHKTQETVKKSQKNKSKTEKRGTELEIVQTGLEEDLPF